jgi:glutathione peroxidase
MFAILSTIPGFAAQAEDGTEKGSSIYQDINLTTLSGNEILASEYKGKVALVVNTASNCGFTGQYSGLESLYQKYRDQGFVVLGFPSNDFGAQEPGTNEEIAHFCESTYGASFPLFHKDHVKGESKQPIYKILTEQSPKDFQGDPGWNFVKFLVDRNGFVRGRYSSMTKPESGKITREIEKLLGE